MGILEMGVRTSGDDEPVPGFLFLGAVEMSRALVRTFEGAGTGLISRRGGFRVLRCS